MVISTPPETFISAPVAPSMSMSKRGLLSARSTASIALFSPSLSPIPIIARPPFVITALMSAKSRFTRPGLVTSSDIPFTAFTSISSATLNAVGSETSGTISSSLSFGITISVSTAFCSLSSPSRAFFILWRPSIVNGKVTIPTVRAPDFFAISAAIGSEPVPVPPPRPQVTNAMSQPSRTFLISFLLSFAASSPTFGSAPAPRPPVISFPISILMSASV